MKVYIILERMGYNIWEIVSASFEKQKCEYIVSYRNQNLSENMLYGEYKLEEYEITNSFEGLV